jgi:amidase/6-aminohexanoate-cyclic-dimer hydrolase
VFNQMGFPAMSVPLHWTGPKPGAPAGLPIGMMFGARFGQEGLLLALAGQLERAAPWAHRRPPVWVG